MRISPLRPLAAGLALLAAAFAAARDPWFPEGPVQPPIAHDVVLAPVLRVPKFPLKSARTLHTDAEIAQARANVAKYPAAQAVMAPILREADYWAAWSDEALRDLVTGAEVPRASECSNAGCPIHGRRIYEGIGGSSYPWIVDPKHPFKAKCPIGGETYPDNDYGAYYRSGFKDKNLLAGKIVDDGWGWVGPDGNRYWFVAHANHMVWEQLAPDSRCIIDGIADLSRAYLITGDRRYAHKAAVLFHRVAQVYPTMNYEQQSNYGRMMAEQGTRYTGKIVNLIWEANLVAPALSEAYDEIWETLDADTELQKFYGQSGAQIRAFIEANYLEEAIDSYFEDKLRGNYGIHQRALLQLAVVRQHGDNARYVDEVLHRPEGHLLRLGFDYAMYDLVFRDGAPHESPDYNFVWPRVYAASAGLLKKLGQDVNDLPRLKRMFDEPLDYVTIGRRSAPLGDSRTRYAPLIGDDSLTYQRALKLFGDARYATFLAGIGATGEKSLGSFDALFESVDSLNAITRDAPPDGRALPPQPSRILSGYGYALLNNPADTRSIGIFYGLHVAHYHFDRLHFDLFAHGQDMMPDLGYPDGANEFNSGIFTWSKTTISHNTVTVDAHRQPANPTGHLELFADGPFARAVTVDGNGTYPQAKTYRRTLVMVDVAPALPGEHRSPAEQGYVVDFFDVVGGHQHDYSLHGPTGKFSLLGGTWSAPEPGTLAGPNVAVGALYDDPVRAAPGFKGSFLDYAGSGFQHLVGVQRLKAGDAVAEYVHDQDPNARLRIRVLPQEGQETITAHARVSPMKFPEPVNFLIARRVAPPGGAELASAFAAVLEPFTTTPSVAEAHRLELTNGTVVVVTRVDGGQDIIIHHEGSDHALFARADRPPIVTDAAVAVISFDAHGEPSRAFFAGGTFLDLGGRRLQAAGFTGKIAAINPNLGELRVKVAPGVAARTAAFLPGRVIHLSNPLRDTVQTVKAAQRDGDDLVITVKDDLRVARIHVGTVESVIMTTKTALHLASIYRGTTLCDFAGQPLATVNEAKPGLVAFVKPPAHDIDRGSDVWLVDGAIGETVQLPAILSWEKP